VVAQLANALRYELGMAEATKAAGTQNPDAIDLAMRGVGSDAAFNAQQGRG
jgi:hypothetical protein